MPNYDPRNWYWIVGGDQTQVFSSASNATVPIDDATYNAWKQNNAPTVIDTLTNLQDVLRDAGVPPYAAVTNIQARLALRQAGLLTQADAAVAAATPDVQDKWQFSSTIYRTNPTVLALAALFNPPLTPAQLDQLFTIAASITP